MGHDEKVEYRDEEVEGSKKYTGAENKVQYQMYIRDQMPLQL